MQHSPFLKLLCLRHGKTLYTGEFPDLTPDGIRDVQTVAKTLVTKWIKDTGTTHDALEIISSPAPRSNGTACTVAETIQYPHPVALEPKLSAMQWRDPTRCKEALKGFAGIGYINYETEPVFADPQLFETPREMRTRWYEYLTDLIERAQQRDLCSHHILVSHYEVFCHIVHDLFEVTASEETALRHGEPIMLSVRPHDLRRVSVSGVFRHIITRRYFDLQSRTFSSQ